MAKPSSECVRVAVRCRPPSDREAGERLAVAVDEAGRQVSLQGGPEAPRAFTFDCVFGQGASQQAVYDATARELVDSALAGYNATLFAFGQTGTGKTHTMEGSGGPASASASATGGRGSSSACCCCGGGGSGELPAAAGIIPRTFRQIFDAIGASQDQTTFLVRASMLEIYNEEIRDLLSKVGGSRWVVLGGSWVACFPIAVASPPLPQPPQDVKAAYGLTANGRWHRLEMQCRNLHSTHPVLPLALAAPCCLPAEPQEPS